MLFAVFNDVLSQILVALVSNVFQSVSPVGSPPVAVTDAASFVWIFTPATLSVVAALVPYTIATSPTPFVTNGAGKFAAAAIPADIPVISKLAAIAEIFLKLNFIFVFLTSFQLYSVVV